MDDYPAYSLDHNVPLLVTIGLPPADGEDEEVEEEEWLVGMEQKQQATVLQSGLPVLEGGLARALRRYLTVDDPAVAPWKGRANPPRYQFRVRTAGRAKLPENFEIGPAIGPVVLHSPFSPLSPSCRLYADGMIDSAWVQKHQALVPSVFLCCYALSTAEAGTAGTAAQDGQIQADINAFKAAVAQSGYRSRVAVVVLADEQSAASQTEAEGSVLVQERLEGIRRGSGVDAKLFFVLSAGASAEEVGRMAENMLTTMGGQALEYYRELGRHVRKKRGRGSAPQPSVPPTVGTSQTLSLPGWHIRYDFKAAVLAEFRQELDAALRALDTAYAALLGPDLLDAIPSWSPRWNEARLLADAIAVRSLRCLLAGGHHSTAVRRWEAHRDRMRDLVDSHGRGSANYGFAAWDARWALVMAGLVERAVPALSARTRSDKLPARNLLLFLPPEKGMGATAVEHLPPWQRLHHSGYWHRLAAGHLRRRRTLARAIPADDRRPPGMSPASTVARLAFAYDDYMCPPPYDEYGAVDHGAMIVTCLEAARAAFVQHGQERLAAEVALECGRELVAARRWTAALDLLAPLWTAAQYRTEAWFAASEELAWTLRAAATALGRADLLVSIHWELLDRRYVRREQKKQADDGVPYDVARALEDVDPDGQEVAAVVALQQLDDLPPSFLSATFAFKTGEGKAGHTVAAQLALHSNAQPGSAPVVLDAVCVRFESGSSDGGGSSSTTIKPLLLRHDTEAKTTGSADTAFFSRVPLAEDGKDDKDDKNDKDDEAQLCGTADLTLRPQSTVVYEVAIPLREAGDARAAVAELRYSCARYSLRRALPFSAGLAGRSKTVWLLSPSASLPVPRPDCHAVHVLPRPPKLAIQLVQAGGRRAAVPQVFSSSSSASSSALPRPHPSSSSSSPSSPQHLPPSALSAQPPATPTASSAAPVLPFYTNEPVDVAFALLNAEDAGADVHLDVVLYGEALPGFTLHVDGDEIDTALPQNGGGEGDGADGAGAGESALRAVPLGVVAAGRRVHVILHVMSVALATTFDVALRAVYRLVDDPATPITQALSMRLSFTNPFEANYDLLPRRHPDAWPSLFDHEGILPRAAATDDDDDDDIKNENESSDGGNSSLDLQPQAPRGLAQAWTLVTRYASFATDDLRIVSLDLSMGVQPAGITCRITRRKHQDKDEDAATDAPGSIHVMHPQTVAAAQFDLDVRRASLEHRDPVSLDVALAIRWQRVGKQGDGADGTGDPALAVPYPVNTTTLPVPRLGIFSTEPRVLASVSYGAGAGGSSSSSASKSLSSLITLTITIENASGHFLTFGLTMEPSGEFAFAGAKLTTIHVLPVSRRTVTYRLLPLVRNAWIRPTLVVRDKYFQKVLRILPTEGLKADKEGILVWVPEGKGEEVDDDDDDSNEDEAEKR